MAEYAWGPAAVRPPAKAAPPQFVIDGKEKRWRIPECAYRGEVVARKDVPCCGGMVRVMETFACSHPKNDGGLAPSIACRDCGLIHQNR